MMNSYTNNFYNKNFKCDNKLSVFLSTFKQYYQ